MTSASKLFDDTTKLLEANLDRRVTKHRIVSRNIANIDTPNFQGTGLEFEKQLRTAIEGGVMPTNMARTNPMHMPYDTGKPFDSAEPEFKNIGPVHLDIEMSKLAENNIMFSAMIQLLNKKFSRLKEAIKANSGG